MKKHHEVHMNVDVKLHPWLTPNNIIATQPTRSSGRITHISEPLSWTLAEVSADVLSEQCDKFRADVFIKAGKNDPKITKN